MSIHVIVKEPIVYVVKNLFLRVQTVSSSWSSIGLSSLDPLGGAENPKLMR